MSDGGESARKAAHFGDMVRCFRMACDPARIWSGLLAVLFGSIVLVVASAAVIEARALAGCDRSARITARAHGMDFGGAIAATQEEVRAACRDAGQEVGRILSGHFPGRVAGSIWWAKRLARDLCGVLIVLLLANIPWSYYGGSINRSAAVEFATGKRLSRFEVRAFAASRRGSYFWPAVVVALAIFAALVGGVVAGVAAGHLLSAAVGVAGCFVSLYVLVVVKQRAESTRAGWVAGLLGVAVTILCALLLWDVRWVWLGRVGAVLAFPVVFVLGVVAMLLTLVLIFGRGVMTSTVSFEGSDSVDAVTRAADYVFRRPWRVGLHWLFALVYGVPCVVFVTGLVWCGVILANLLIWMSFGNSFADIYEGLAVLRAGVAMTESVPSFLLAMVLVILWGLVAGWCVSFVQCYRAISYALLRQSVDQSGPSEVFLEPGIKSPARPELSQPQQ